MTPSVPSALTRLDHRLLGHLADHRVLTTARLVRLTETPERTVDYRLARFYRSKLVARTRPYRDRGSAPYHWWLTRKGLRLVEPDQPGTRRDELRPQFVAHTAAVAGVHLALSDPPSGLQPVNWSRDEDAWEAYDRPPGWPARITPDGHAHLQLTAVEDPPWETCLFVEVDLGTMSQNRLRMKAANYLAWSANRSWTGRHPHCPPVLLLTTSERRALGFLAGTRRLLTSRHSPYRRADADELTVAACGLVTDIDRAVHHPVWLTSDHEPPWTLVDLLTAVASRHRSLDEQAARARAMSEQQTPSKAVDAILDGGQGLLDALGDPDAARLLHLAIHDRPPRDRVEWASAHVDLVLGIDRWWVNRTQPLSNRYGLPVGLLMEVRDLKTELWREQVRLLLDTSLAIAESDPRLHRLARRLLDGELVTFGDLAEASTQPVDAAREQAALLAPYLAERAKAVAVRHAALHRRQRRRMPIATLEAAYDAEHLLVCRDCGSQVPHGAQMCPLCRGALDAWPERQEVPSLTDTLTALRRVLKKETTHDPPPPR